MLDGLLCDVIGGGLLCSRYFLMVVVLMPLVVRVGWIACLFSVSVCDHLVYLYSASWFGADVARRRAGASR